MGVQGGLGRPGIQGPRSRGQAMGNFTRRKFGCNFGIFCGFLDLFGNSAVFRNSNLRKTYVLFSSRDPNLRNSPQNLHEKRRKTTQKTRAQNFPDCGGERVHRAPWQALADAVAFRPTWQTWGQNTGNGSDAPEEASQAPRTEPKTLTLACANAWH